MNKNLSKAEIKAMLKSKQLIKRYRFITLFFTFLPFLLEDWLNEMQKKGYVLYRMKNRVLFFSFLFEKSEKNASYSVDVRTTGVDKSYFDHHEECGWQLMYTPVIKNSGYSVWMRLNEGEQKEADFFSDAESKIEPTKNSIKLYLIGIAAFWALTIIMIVIAKAFSLSEKFLEYCYMFFTVSFLYTVPVLFVLSFYWHMKRKNGNTSVTQRNFAKRILAGNIILFFGTILVFVLSTILTATTENLADGTTQINLLSDVLLIHSIQIGLLIGILIAFFALFVTIPYYIIRVIKK